jgi:hypothetical protein
MADMSGKKSLFPRFAPRRRVPRGEGVESDGYIDSNMDRKTWRARAIDG